MRGLGEVNALVMYVGYLPPGTCVFTTVIYNVPMGSWDEVCIICGISPSADPQGSGPSWLFTHWDGQQGAEFAKIVAEVVSINGGDSIETLAIVSDALLRDIYENNDTIDLLRKVMPGLCDWSGFKRCMAIGQFGDDGEATREGDDENFPDGRQVEVRLVEGFDSASFNKVLKVDDRGEEKAEFAYSWCGAFEGNPNLFTSEGCYHYLHAWIDWSTLPPRKQAFPSDPAPLPFGAELYEIVNSQKMLRSENLAHLPRLNRSADKLFLDESDGELPCIDYDGIIETVRQFQSYFHPARQGSKHLARAIRDGLRGSELLPSIMRDFRCWMFVRPDL